jgi:CHAT domain-containing protein
VTLSNTAYVRRALGQLPAALDAYRQAIAIMERQRSAIALEELRASLTADWGATYAAAVEVLLQLGRPAEAFDMAERGRARALLDQLAGGRMDIRPDYRQGTDAELLAQEESLRADLARVDRLLRQERAKPSAQRSVEQSRVLADQLSRKQREYDDLLARIKLSAPGYAELLSGSPLVLADVQKLLPPDVTLVSYYLTLDRTLAFIVSGKELHVVELPMTPAQLREAVATSRQSLLAQGSMPPSGLTELHDWLIAPIRKHLTTRVVGIVPHDVLHYLPFGALPMPKPNLALPGQAGEQRYLSDEFILFTLPSASTLSFVQDRPPGDGAGESVTPLLAAAYGRAEGLPPLRFAEQEGREIAGMYGVEPLIGSAATESSFREQVGRARLIHVAAHGQLNAANPLFSRLVLAPDQANDGSLEVHEVYGLDLRHADLVTLSACQTQLGVRSGGDDLVGLSRAFIAGAGVPTVVASLWSVDDEATAALMRAFYAGMRSGLGKAEALQAAQTAVRTDKTHPEWAQPYYWAAFTLTGNPGSVKARTTPGWQPWIIGIGVLLVVLVLGVVIGRRLRRRGSR